MSDLRVQRSSSQRNAVGENQKSAGEETRRAQAGNGSTDDQGDRVLSNTADQAAYLKDEDGSQVNPLEAQEGVELSEQQLESGGGEKIGLFLMLAHATFPGYQAGKLR